MAPNPMISVVMSAYNEEKYLAPAIQSVLDQSFEEFEFIIIDDCSTDATSQILKEFAEKDDRIRLIKKDKNKGFKGFVENLNLGISEAKGKYIARMDADDICLPERFEKQWGFLEKDPNIFLCGSSIILIDAKNLPIGKMEALTEFEAIKKRTKIDNPIFHPAIMFRREEDLYYRDKMYGCEDFDFYLRCITEGRRLTNLPETLVKYRVLDDSISRGGDSFVKRLFLEQSKKFYSERLKSGRDSYDEFDEKEFLNILNPGYTNKIESLKFAADTALLYDRRDELNSIAGKLKGQYDYSNLLIALSKNKGFRKFISFLKRRLR